MKKLFDSVVSSIVDAPLWAKLLLAYEVYKVVRLLIG